MPGQRRLALKSVSRAHCPDADCIIEAPGGQLGAVVVPGDGHDNVRVTVQRRPNGCTAFSGPKTNTVVTTTSTRRQLFPRMIEAHRQHAARVPGQGGYALTRLRVPDPDGVVPASACYFCAAWAVNHRRDPAFSMRCISTRSNSGRVRKLDFFF